MVKWLKLKHGMLVKKIDTTADTGVCYDLCKLYRFFFQITEEPEGSDITGNKSLSQILRSRVATLANLQSCDECVHCLLVCCAFRTGWSVNLDESFLSCSSGVRKAAKFGPWSTTRPSTATISASWTSPAETSPLPSPGSPGRYREGTMTSARRGGESSRHISHPDPKRVGQTSSMATMKWTKPGKDVMFSDRP